MARGIIGWYKGKKAYIRRKRRTVNKGSRSRRLFVGGFNKKMGLSMNTHRFSRRVQLFGPDYAINTTIATTTGVAGGYATTAFNFLFNQLPNYAEYSVLFDEYKINRVKLIITCLNTNVTQIDQLNYAIGLPKLYFVHDEDDVTPPSASYNGLLEMQERVKVRMYSFTPTRNTVTIWVKPNLLANNYKSISSTAYTPVYNRWVDFQDVAAPYYGAKMLFYVPSATTTLPDNAKHYFTIEAVYYFTCKDVR